MSKLKIAILSIFLLISVKSFSQMQPPPEFFQGMQLATKNPDAAKHYLLIAAAKAPDFYGTYHFLGTICLDEKKTDSAIYFLKKSIALNKDNANRTKEFTYFRLIDFYLQQHDFNTCYQTAVEALRSIPNSQLVAAELKDVSLWAFYIKDDGLDASYLSHEIKPEYAVTSIPQEYLISRNLRLKDENLAVVGQSLIKKDNADYDVLNCVSSTSKETVKLFFKLNWDMSKYFGGKVSPTQPIIDNAAKYSPIERLGAMFVTDSKTDILAALDKVGQN